MEIIENLRLLITRKEKYPLPRSGIEWSTACFMIIWWKFLIELLYLMPGLAEKGKVSLVALKERSVSLKNIPMGLYGELISKNFSIVLIKIFYTKFSNEKSQIKKLYIYYGI